ncbi:MAG TPA: hypothetical protein VGW98_10455 [Solirubrobacteraceae bacterium]|jgi:hypothetical protein|nr:hypothetical protein [Solirubrobacteraceae bacterium]
MRERRFSPSSALAGALAGLALAVTPLLIGAVSSGRSRGSAAPLSPVKLVGGVPVGVEHSPTGALAAADNYLAIASQSVEQDPGSFAALLAQAYTPEARAAALAQARKLRAEDVQNSANYEQGGHGIAVIAARRLDKYLGTEATVTSWLGGFVWGPRLTPRQSWNLVDTTLRWQSGRWLVAASRTDPVSAPVPSIVYVDGPNDQSQAFARLAGMSAPFYGTGG